MNNNIIKTEGLTKQFKSGDGYITVLKGINLEIKKGEILSVVGPSGAGKSTLLHIIGFLDKPTSGKIYLKEKLIDGFSDGEITRLRSITFGFVFQFYHLIQELTVLENTILPFMVRHSALGWLSKKSDILRKARELLERLRLGHRLNQKVNRLSGGESQRVAIARALIAEPEIILCDEPTGNLDQATSREIQEIIWDMNHRTGQTFVLVTHDENIARKANRVVHLVDGCITN